MNVCITRSLLLGFLALILSAGAFSVQPDELFRTHVYSDTVLVEPGADESFDFDVDLIVSGPKGFYHRQSYPAGSIVEFDPSMVGQGQLPDGTYKYELRIMGTGQQLVRGMDQPETASATLSSPHSGAFTVKNGSFLPPDEVEPVAGAQSPQKSSGESSLETDDADDDGSRDFVINDDEIVIGSLCVGFDCVNGETFGFDTVRLKENNTRIKFEDTSAGAFPSNDWELTANDSANGGLNRFSIMDVDAARNIFTVEAGARSNSLYVESDGDVGLGTNNPVIDLHVVTGNTPGMRLEQDGSSGFTPQTWDVAGNESNFFVRDATNGSTLPFRIRPGAPSSAIDIAAGGNVGIGTASPSAALTVQRSNGTAKLEVKETSGTSAIRELFLLENHGRPRFVLSNTDISAGGPHKWTMDVLNDGLFRWTLGGSGVNEMELEPGGDLTIAGTLTQSSDRTKKNNFEEVNPTEILSRVLELPVSRWTFNHDPSGIFHMGPMAQDFYAAFGLGEDETKIAPLDTNGVALAAIQGLKLELDERDQRIAELEEQVNELKAGMGRVASMEARLQELDERIADSILVKIEDVTSTSEVVQSNE